MHPVAARMPLRAPDDAALVVFVRPSSFAAGYVIPIIDDQGRFLGEAGAKTHFAVVARPGDHMFVAWRENTTFLRARLLPGKTYFVEVATKPGMFQARTHLLAVAPRTKSWAKLPDWMHDTEEQAPDLEAGQRSLDADRDAVQNRLQSADEALSDADDVDLEARTLHPDDGV
jgi:hypothetical protein